MARLKQSPEAGRHFQASPSAMSWARTVVLVKAITMSVTANRFFHEFRTFTRLEVKLFLRAWQGKYAFIHPYYGYFA